MGFKSFQDGDSLSVATYGRTVAVEKKEETGLANPAPLGLLGFGMTTVLLNIHNAGIIDATSLGMILAMGIFYGGLAQVIAGIMEFKKGNVFGATAFSSYGLFWWSLVGLLLLPKMGYADPVGKGGMAAYFFMWGLFTFCMYISTLKKNRALQTVFFTLFILFFMLMISELSGSEALLHLTGYEGILCGASAIYLAIAEITNEIYGQEVLPIGEIKEVEEARSEYPPGRMPPGPPVRGYRPTAPRFGGEEHPSSPYGGWR